MMNKPLLVALSLALLFSTAQSASYSPKPLEIGQAAPDFTLPGIDGKTYRLADFAKSKVLAIIFTCNHCPTAQAYEDRIMKMHEAYTPKGVALVAITSNDPLAVRLDELGYTDLGDSFEDTKTRAQHRGFKFPYLFDGDTQATGKAYGALATPHVFIFDAERKLRYTGRIDDGEVKPVTSPDMRNALDALLAGKPVPAEKTRVFGCSTKWSDKREDAARSLAKWNAEPVELKDIQADQAKALTANDTKKLRLINVWATWCQPCVIELPELVTMNRMYRHRDFELITISMDDPARKDKALEQLTKLHVSAGNFIFAGDNRDKLAEALDPKWEGPLPHTILIAPGGKVLYRKTGQFDPLELKRAIVDYLGRTY